MVWLLLCHRVGYELKQSRSSTNFQPIRWCIHHASTSKRGIVLCIPRRNLFYKLFGWEILTQLASSCSDVTSFVLHAVRWEAVVRICKHAGLQVPYGAKFDPGLLEDARDHRWHRVSGKGMHSVVVGQACVWREATAAARLWAPVAVAKQCVVGWCLGHATARSAHEGVERDVWLRLGSKHAFARRIMPLATLGEVSREEALHRVSPQQYLGPAGVGQDGGHILHPYARHGASHTSACPQRLRPAPLALCCC